jgi:hypothetical protein
MFSYFLFLLSQLLRSKAFVQFNFKGKYVRHTTLGLNGLALGRHNRGQKNIRGYLAREIQ